MTVWVVEHGEYSDVHVVAVTDDESKADAIAALGSSGRCQAFELNVFADRLLQGIRRWEVTFLQSTGDCVSVEQDYDPFDLTPREPVLCSFPNPPSSGRQVLGCIAFAGDKDLAVKIASEQRRVWIAGLRP